MSTKGWWDNVFGLTFLRLGNLQFEVAIPVTPHVTITQLELGCMAEIGYQDAVSKVFGAKPLEASLYVGMDVLDYSNNYVLGNVSELTIPSFYNAFAIKT